MTKSHHKKRLFNSSGSLEGYSRRLAAAETEDTVPTTSDSISPELGETNDSLPDTIPISDRNKPNKFIELLTSKQVTAFVAVLAIIGVIVFGYQIVTSVFHTETKVVEIENKVDNLSKDNLVQHNDMNITLAKILEKFDRLFDNLTRNRR